MLGTFISLMVLCMVPVKGLIGSSGYYRDRGSQLIRLNRQSPDGVITGQFRCEIPNVSGTMVNLFINIGM